MKRKAKVGISVFLLFSLLFSGIIPPGAQAEAAGKMKLNRKKLSMRVGQTKILKVKNRKKGQKIIWKTSRKNVASVSQKGKVTAKKAGTATITAKAGGRRFQCKVTVAAKKKADKAKNKPAPTFAADIGERDEMAYIDNRMEEVPTGYFQTIKKGGTVKKFTYQAGSADGAASFKKNAMVYLPAGYDSSNAEQKYDIIYLMHGSGENEQTFLGDGGYDSGMKSMLDHMIVNGDIPPCIVCTPTLEKTDDFEKEFQYDLIPAVEGKYHTYYNGDSVEDSREHRIFAGFSMGASETWRIFAKCMNAVSKYIPISGASACAGQTAEQEIAYLTEAVAKQGYTAEDLLVFYGSGDKGDIGYDGVKSQVKEMKKGTGVFTFCDNFTNGNLYYGMVKDGGHDINTVYMVLYNALQSMLSKPRTPEKYHAWAEGIMAKKEPAKLDKKKMGNSYGKWKKYHYYSRTAKRKTGVNVLLPPDYSRDEKYPVLYLLHGYYDNEDSLASSGYEIRKILGNLIGAGKAKEMIVVLPYIFCSPDRKKCTEMNLENSLCYDNFVNDLLKDVMPFINKKFSVAEGRENTAITGFSMGGRESVFIGVSHPELFGYVGAVCPAPGLTPGSSLDEHPGQLKEEELVFPEKKEPYLFLLSAAKEDPAVGQNPLLLHKILEKNQTEHLWNIIPKGGHDTVSVRVHLYNYLRMIFRYRR